MLVNDAVALSEALTEAERVDSERRMAELKGYADFAVSLVDNQTRATLRAVAQMSAAMVRRG